MEKKTPKWTQKILSFLQLRLNIRILIIITTIAVILGLFIGGMAQIKKFVNKGYTTSIYIKFTHKKNYDSIKVYPLSLKNTVVYTQKIHSNENIISGTYYKALYLGINKSIKGIPEDLNITISFSRKKFTITKNNFNKVTKVISSPSFIADDDYTIYKLSDSIRNSHSIIPFVNKLIGWPGDLYFFKNFFLATLQYFLLFFSLLIIFVLAFSSMVIGKDEIRWFNDNDKIKFYEYYKKDDENTHIEEHYKQKSNLTYKQKTFLFFFLLYKRIVYLFSNKAILITFSVFLILEILDIFVIQKVGHFNTSKFYIIPFYVNKIIIDWFLFIASSLLFLKLIKYKFIGLIYSTLYIFILTLDISLLFFGNTLFQKTHIRLTTGYSLLGFLSVQSVLLTAILVIILFIANFFLIKSLKHFKWKHVIQAFTIVIFMYIVNIPNILFNIKLSIPANSVNLSILREQKKQLNYYTKNSAINFLTEIFFGKVQNNIKIIHNYSQYDMIIKKYGLALGKKDYQNLHLKQFNKIIVFTTESLSLDFLSGYNKKLPVTTSTFYNSPEIKDKMFTHYKTTAHNTLEGLTAIYNSNPNAEGLINNERNDAYFKNSLPNILHRNGYKTIFLRSASRYYAGENIYFKKLGFRQIIAREDFESKYKKYVSEWGVCDRIMYNRLIELLKRHRNDKVFISIIGTDTHLLKGRRDYKGLDYPTIPSNYNSLGEEKEFLESVYYHDYDIKLVLDKIKQNGLLTDDTLIILTADHACPFNSMVNGIKGYPKKSLIRIPLVFITTQKLPAVNKEELASQVNLSPTILHMLNIKVPDGYWGDSLFSSRKKPHYVGYDQGVIYIEDNSHKYEIIKAKPKNQDEENLVKLFNSLIIN